MVSGGSCDTEDLKSNAENSALHHGNKVDFKYIDFTVFLIK